MDKEKYRHILLKEGFETSSFTSTQSGGSRNNPQSRDRASHSALLRTRLSEAWDKAESEQAVSHVDREGIYVEFISDPGAELVIESLEDIRSKKIRLLNVRTDRAGDTAGIDDQTTFATVFVSHDKKDHFLKKIEQYANEDTQWGRPRNERLITSISDIRKALEVSSFWQDPIELAPSDEPKWCEVWLSSDSAEVKSDFEQLISKLKIESRSGHLSFPERTVKVILATRHQLAEITKLSDDIAEYRLAKTTARFWVELENVEQAEWVEDLLGRLETADNPDVSVCILDTGINTGHPLISPILSTDDQHTVDPGWGVHDHDKHGTLMAGLAGYGDIKESIASKENVQVEHCIESVKIIPRDEKNPIDLWGHVTVEGVSRAEVRAPHRRRVVCMAVAAEDTRDRGRPSSWSGAIDQLSSGANDDQRRLIILCTGNADPSSRNNYPSAQVTDSIHDPGQSWNALTVGAHTKLQEILSPELDGYSPIAPDGGLSPYSTTSHTWEDKWPIKPEIVLEGGNMAVNASGFATECDDLSLLSTYYKPHESHFYPFCMTSAAAAQAAWMAARIQTAYPEFWPETIRALLVHSADWPNGLLEQFGGDKSKTAIAQLMSTCGYGVPNLDRAMHSAADSLTLIAQEEIQPFDRKRDDEGKPIQGYRTKDMHLYDLPWPTDVLRGLPDNTPVEMRVTLSYFIEPGPGEIGWKDRYRYPSHLLRFSLISPTETKEEFEKRINIDARQEDEGHPGTNGPSEHWQIGQSRDKGSIHSDRWRGTAQELANSNLIAVRPGIGWWRERHYLNHWNRKTRYSLVVSIHTPEQDIDVYTPVATQVGIPIPVPVTS